MRFIITCLLFILFAGCSNFPYMPNVEQGSPINTAEFKKVHIGDDEATVVTTLGQPSFKHIDHNNQWYYMIENSKYKKPLVFKLVFNNNHLMSIRPNQSV